MLFSRAITSYCTLLVCVFVVTLTVQAQDYVSGYILKSPTDTLKGYLKAINFRTAAKRIDYKPDLNSPTTTFSVDMIYGYHYASGEFFVAKEIQIEPDVFEVVFLQHLVDGLKDLYFYNNHTTYKDKENLQYFIENTESGTLDPLIIQKGTVQKGYKTYAYSRENYKNTLNYVFRDSPAAIRKIDAAKLTHKSLIKLTTTYHYDVCTADDQCTVYQAKREKPLQTLSINYGSRSTKIPEVSGLDSRSLRDILTNIELGPDQINFSKALIGIRYQRNFPYLNNNLFLGLNFFHSSLNEEGSVIGIRELEGFPTLDLDYNYSYDTRAFLGEVSLSYQFDIKRFSILPGILYQYRDEYHQQSVINLRRNEFPFLIWGEMSVNNFLTNFKPKLFRKSQVAGHLISRYRFSKRFGMEFGGNLYFYDFKENYLGQDQWDITFGLFRYL